MQLWVAIGCVVAAAVIGYIVGTLDERDRWLAKEWTEQSARNDEMGG